MFMWVGLQVNPELLQQLFHANTIGQVDIEMVSIGFIRGLFQSFSYHSRDNMSFLKTAYMRFLLRMGQQNKA